MKHQSEDSLRYSDSQAGSKSSIDSSRTDGSRPNVTYVDLNAYHKDSAHGRLCNLTQDNLSKLPQINRTNIIINTFDIDSNTDIQSSLGLTDTQFSSCDDTDSTKSENAFESCSEPAWIFALKNDPAFSCEPLMYDPSTDPALSYNAEQDPEYLLDVDRFIAQTKGSWAI
jgi:hypothetical protein